MGEVHPHDACMINHATIAYAILFSSSARDPSCTRIYKNGTVSFFASCCNSPARRYRHSHGDHRSAPITMIGLISKPFRRQASNEPNGYPVLHMNYTWTVLTFWQMETRCVQYSTIVRTEEFLADVAPQLVQPRTPHQLRCDVPLEDKTMLHGRRVHPAARCASSGLHRRNPPGPAAWSFPCFW